MQAHLRIIMNTNNSCLSRLVRLKISRVRRIMFDTPVNGFWLQLSDRRCYHMVSGTPFNCG